MVRSSISLLSCRAPVTITSAAANIAASSSPSSVTNRADCAEPRPTIRSTSAPNPYRPISIATTQTSLRRNA